MQAGARVGGGRRWRRRRRGSTPQTSHLAQRRDFVFLGRRCAAALFISAVKMPAGVSGRTSEPKTVGLWVGGWVGSGGRLGAGGVRWGWLVWKLTSVL